MIERDLLHFGYLFVLFGVAIEGDATLLTAALLARQGHLHLYFVIVVAAVGASAASQAYFEVARFKGDAWIAGLPISPARVEKVRSWAEKYGALLIVGSRFLFGFRTLVPIICGASGMKQWWFTFWNAAGALLWAVVVGVVGFFGVHTLVTLVLDIRRHELLAASVTAIVSCAVIGWVTRAHDWSDVWRLTSRR